MSVMSRILANFSPPSLFIEGTFTYVIHILYSYSVRATPETAEDLTQSISAGGKSKDIFNSVEIRKVYYSPAGGKSKEKKLKGSLLHGALSVYINRGKTCDPQPHHMGVT